MSELTAGLIVAHSQRLEDLTDLVVQLTRNYPLPPLTNECVVVQSNGIAQWLQIQLAQQAGIAALLQVTLPARLQWQLYRAVLGPHIPRTSPFDKPRLRWRLLRLLPTLLPQPLFAPLRDYVAHDPEQRKLFQLAERLADLFDQYQWYRPQWLAAWAEGEDAPASAEQAWQPALWRALLADIGAERWHNRAYLHQDFIAAAQQLTPAQRPAGVPPRIVVFGMATLPLQFLQVLDALKGCCQILLCVQNPSQYHWSDQAPRRQPVKPEHTLSAPSHPLLEAWGRQGRDFLRMLEVFDETKLRAAHLNELSFDLFTSQPTPHLLQQLQDDILQLRSLSETQQQWPRWQPDDPSLIVNSAHSAQREVEILHDHLLACFQADASLQPRDVMVMVPDIDAYAATIEAVFGRFDRTDPRFIPYRLADQGVRQQEPLLMALEQLLRLPQQRLNVSEVLDLLQVGAIQQKLGLAAHQLPLLQQWIQQAGVRWALHQQHREQQGVAGYQGRHSWHFGIQRMLLGYAYGWPEDDQAHYQEIVPMAEVAGLEASAVGALAQLLQQLEALFDSLSTARTVAEWVHYIQQLLEQFFSPSNDQEIALMQRLYSSLQQWQEDAESADLQQPLPLEVVHESWLATLDQSSLQQRFFAGRVNFATLMPMRAIPFKIVCLLGLNDGDYPRTQKPYDFDLMAHDYQPGDRSRRDDDRYLFLEALLSARQQLYLSWQGQHQRDNSPRPPSVLLSQLLEHVQLGWQAELVQQHRLQPFHRDYFQRETPALRQFFSYAYEWQAAHQQRTDDASAPLELWLPEQPLSTRQLADFLREPAKLLCQQRFGMYFFDHALRSEDEETLIADGLAYWQLKDQLQQLLVAQWEQHQGASWPALLDARMAQLQRAGELPVGAAGLALAQQLSDDCADLVTRLRPWFEQYPQVQAALAIEQRMQVAGGAGLWCWQDSVLGLRRSHAGELLLLRSSASKLQDPEHPEQWPTGVAGCLSAWLEHVAVNSIEPCQTILLGMPGLLRLAPLPKAQAQSYIEILAQAVVDGLRQPLAIDFMTVYQGWQDNYKNPASWLKEVDPDYLMDAERGHEFFQEGKSMQAPHRLKVPYLARFYTDYECLTGAASQHLVHTLYTPMLRSMLTALSTLGGTDGDAE